MATIELDFDQAEWDLIRFAVDLYRTTLQNDPYYQRLADSPGNAAMAEGIAARIFAEANPT